MKKILFTVGLWCLALCMQAAGHISRLRAELQDSRSDYVFVVAHRGDWRHAPENSVAAIKGAADMEEALTACKGAVLVNIDKGGDYLSEIAPIIRKTGTEDHVVLKGRGTVEEVERQLSGYKDILYMPVVDLDGEGAIPYVASFLSAFRPQAVEVIFKTDRFAKLSYLPVIAASDCRVWINTLWASLCGGHEDEKALSDPDAHWGWVLDRGATVIQTDRPEELIEYLKKKGRRNL